MIMDYFARVCMCSIVSKVVPIRSFTCAICGVCRMFCSTRPLGSALRVKAFRKALNRIALNRIALTERQYRRIPRSPVSKNLRQFPTRENPSTDRPWPPRCFETTRVDFSSLFPCGRTRRTTPKKKKRHRSSPGKAIRRATSSARHSCFCWGDCRCRVHAPVPILSRILPG